MGSRRSGSRHLLVVFSKDGHGSITLYNVFLSHPIKKWSNSRPLESRLTRVTCFINRTKQTWHSGTSKGRSQQALQLLPGMLALGTPLSEFGHQAWKHKSPGKDTCCLTAPEELPAASQLPLPVTVGSPLGCPALKCLQMTTAPWKPQVKTAHLGRLGGLVS